MRWWYFCYFRSYYTLYAVVLIWETLKKFITKLPCLNGILNSLPWPPSSADLLNTPPLMPLTFHFEEISLSVSLLVRFLSGFLPSVLVRSPASFVSQVSAPDLLRVFCGSTPLSVSPQRFPFLDSRRHADFSVCCKDLQAWPCWIRKQTLDFP